MIYDGLGNYETWAVYQYIINNPDKELEVKCITNSYHVWRDVYDHLDDWLEKDRLSFQIQQSFLSL